jgi:hypothetical protein
MPTYKDTITIRDRPHDRTVEVTVTAPKGVSITNLQELAERAWRSPKKETTTLSTSGRVTVKVKAFSR